MANKHGKKPSRSLLITSNYDEICVITIKIKDFSYQMLEMIWSNWNLKNC